MTTLHTYSPSGRPVNAARHVSACKVASGLLAFESLEPLFDDARAQDTKRKRAVTNHSDLVIAVALHRDRDAFRELFDYFAPRLRSFLQRRGADGAEAEEIVQETMVRVWRKAEKFNPDKAAASTWIFTIGRNAHIDMVRRAGRPEIDTDDPTYLPEPEADPVARIAQGQDASRVRAAMNELPKEQRDILMLAYFEDKPHGRIAEQLEIPLGTVKSRIRLAFKRLRADLGENE